MNKEFWAQVKDITTIAKDTFQVSFSYDEGSFKYSPGQYVWVVLPQLTYPDLRGEQRAFSITSAISDTNSLSIQFRNSESGFKKTLLSLQPGSKVKITGPFGSSYVPSNDQKRIVMIAGGVGIAPFLSILRSLETNQNQSQYTLLYLNSSPDSGVFYDELKGICSSHNFPFINHIGSLNENVFPSSIDFANDIFFICGPIGMVDEVYRILTTKNVPFEHMHFEQHYPSTPGNLTEEDFKLKPNERNIMLQAVQDSRYHVIVTDVNGLVIFANKRAQENTGFTFDEMRGNTARLWGGLMPVEFYRSFWHKKHEAVGFDGELTNRRKNGEIYYVLAHISRIVDANNTIIGYIGSEEDITERVNLEIKLKNQNESLSMEKQKDEAILASIGDGVIVVDKKGVVLLANPSALNMFGYSDSEMTGKPFVDMVFAVDEAGVPVSREKRAITVAIESNMKIIKQYTYTRKDGTKFDSSIVNTPLSEAGAVIGGVLSIRDITAEKKIDKAKTEFISLASHQLRTPLSTINWYCEMLLSGDAGQITDEQKKFVEEAYEGSQRMVKLVNALLNVSRIEAGTYMVDPQNVNIIKLTRSVLDESKPQIDEKKLTVTLENEDIPEIMLDPSLMTIIMQNLLTNSIKYTPTGGKITVFLKQIRAGELFDGKPVTQDNLLIQVEDNGMGVPSSQKNQIFQKLFRADNVRRSNTDGTGLGLYLVKSLIEHSLGKIWFTSEEGKGTSFFVLLPLSGMIKKEGDKKIE